MEPREVETVCVKCGAEILSGDGRYWFGHKTFVCQTCGDPDKRMVAIPRGFNENYEDKIG